MKTITKYYQCFCIYSDGSEKTVPNSRHSDLEDTKEAIRYFRASRSRGGFESFGGFERMELRQLTRVVEDTWETILK